MNASAYPTDDQDAPAPFFTFHQDAGHGWLEASVDLIDQLGLKNEIPRYSYMQGGRVYLEEDQDAGTFITAYKARFGTAPDIRDAFYPGGKHPDQSAIRGMAPYTPTRYLDQLKKRA